MNELIIRESLSASDAALVVHNVDTLQRLITKFSDSCKLFGLSISLKKTYHEPRLTFLKCRHTDIEHTVGAVLGATLIKASALPPLLNMCKDA